MNIRILPRLTLAILVIGFCIWQLFPLDKSVRLGKDLRGGVSMVYSVAMPEQGDSQRVLAQVVESLKRRVNPQGVLDISLQPQGLDRIEVVMPLPSAEVRALGDAYRTELASVASALTISGRELDQALAAGTAVDLAPPAPAGAAAVIGSRREALVKLQLAFNEATAARSEYQTALAQNAGPDITDSIELRIAQSELTEREIRATIHSSNIDESRLKRAFSLSAVAPFLRDSAGRIKTTADGSREQGISPRDAELAQLKQQIPDASAQIDAVAAAQSDYSAKVTGYDDPEDLKRLLRGAGVLEFHISVSASAAEGVNPDEMRKQLVERGPDGTDSTIARWFPINDPKQWADTPAKIESLLSDPTTYLRNRDFVATKYNGVPYVLLYITQAMSLDHLGGRQWAMKNVFASQDDMGRTSVAFQLDPAGGMLMGQLTGANVGRPMGIVLDGQLFSAPNLESQISNNGQITGSFSQDEISYLIRVLQGGELEAKLHPEPISVSILGPALGSENLTRGLWAVLIASCATAIMMLLYYFGAGLIADFAILLNVAMIFGIMAGIDGAFTLPGLAGIALSVGMAVDANVLIYERTREELVDRGEPLKTAIDLGFSRAFSAIVDGNVTNLIACVVLYKTAATEVKGFALTMTIGVLTTLFTALFCTRIIFAILINWFGLKRLPMLPTVFPGVMKFLRPNVNWLGQRWGWWTAAIAVSVACFVLVLSVGREILETEFRGGVTMTLMTRKANAGEPTSASGRLLLPRESVEATLHQLGESATTPALRELRTANVLTVGETSADGASSGFQVKVGNPATLTSDETVTDALVAAVAGAFSESLNIVQPVRFAGADDPEGALFTQAITADTVGGVIGRPEIKDSARDFLGGVVVVLKDLQPPISIEDAEARIARMGKQPDFSAISSRPLQIVGIQLADATNPSKGWSSLAVMITEPTALLSKVDAATWERVVAKPSWKLIQAAFTSKMSLDQVNSFSPKVAENLAASAIVAIVVSLIGMILYIWLRFSNLRYSMATITAVAFNVLVCLGALALSVRISGTDIARLSGIQEFRIDLNVIAGLLTIIGYSLNDTIVILDRIRENKGKLAHASWNHINDAINQTFSRTLMTGGSTFLSAVVLYYWGGPAIQPFAFTFIVGLVAGTISSVVIAAPMTYIAKQQRPSADLTRTLSGEVVNPTPV
ncbi:MAG: protein translocase subunit SecD [Phycisphaerales bacterium]|nr:protein translocase subunit SecD [Phycisphaerales bacterium]